MGGDSARVGDLLGRPRGVRREQEMGSSVTVDVSYSVW
jgi:hypothetical protein